MSNINKYTSKEALNISITSDWNVTEIDDNSTPWVSGEDPDETQHIDVTGYHKILFTYTSVANPIEYMAYTFSTSPSDIVLSSSTSHMEIQAGTFEIIIPTSINGREIKSSDTVYWNIVASHANNIIRYVKE
tara:strand:- start:637 stop:1032 length:396 start_codon:yes stop_codon:yes gene_type:complete